MFKDCVAVLSIGTSSINFIIGESGVNNTFIFRAKKTIDCYPFYDGNFTDINQLESHILKAICEIKESSEISSIDTVYVGIPGEFFKLVTKNYKLAFNKVRKITKKEINALYELGFEDTDCEYALAHKSAVYFAVDSYKTDNPYGLKSSSLGGRLCYYLVNTNFKEVITNILRKVGVKKIKYISEEYAKAQILFTKSERDACKILVDVGGSSTSVSIICGDGVLFSSSLPLGGGILSATLSEKLNCDYFVAEQLKKKINIGLKPTEMTDYIVEDDDFYSFSIVDVNEATCGFLDELAESIDGVLASCKLKIPSDVDVAFTGGGICHIRGAVCYISSKIGSLPITVAPHLPHYDKPEYSARIALLSSALKHKNDKIFFTDKE